jgi:CxxC motif-containing protein (DUF1111 family)
MQKFTKTQVSPPSTPFFNHPQTQQLHLKLNIKGRLRPPQPLKIKTIKTIFNIRVFKKAKNKNDKLSL